MKAISIRQPWAALILEGRKSIETRVWSTHYRGDLLICSSLSGPAGYDRIRFPRGVAVCITQVVECRPMTEADEPAACCKLYAGAFAWLLTNIRPVDPVPIKGALKFFEVPDERIRLLSRQIVSPLPAA